MIASCMDAIYVLFGGNRWSQLWQLWWRSNGWGLILPTALIKYNADLIINMGKTYNNELIIYDEVNIILEILRITHK